MKKLVSVVEVEKEGFVALLGQKVVVFCARYIYTGVLAGVNDTCVLLQNPEVVYETGSFKDSKFKDSQPLWNKEWYIQLSSIESYGSVEGLVK